MKKVSNAAILHPLINNVLSAPISSAKTTTDVVANQKNKMSHRMFNNQGKSTEKGGPMDEKDNNRQKRKIQTYLMKNRVMERKLDLRSLQQSQPQLQAAESATGSVQASNKSKNMKGTRGLLAKLGDKYGELEIKRLPQPQQVAAFKAQKMRSTSMSNSDLGDILQAS